MLSALPGLGSRYAYWRLLEYILFSDFRDENGSLIGPSDQIGYLIGKQCLVDSRNFDRFEFLRAFSADVFPVRTTSHSGLQGRASLLEAEVPAEIERLATLENMRRLQDGHVFMATGAVWTRARAAAERRRHYEEYAALENSSPSPEINELVKYLNSLPPNRFSKVAKLVPEARSVANALPVAREEQLRLLGYIEQFPQPLYRPAVHTARIYGSNPSLLRSKREIRNVLTRDWLSCDLRSAQLAIISTIWECPKLKTFLESGSSIWQELATHMMVESDPHGKGKLKDVVYGLCFGRSLNNLRKDLATAFPASAGAAGRFLGHPLIAEVALARKRAFAEARNHGYIVDVFGVRREVRPKPSISPHWQEDTARSALAALAQSIEMRLMLPIAELAYANRGTGGFTITFWLHDGCGIAVHDSNRMQSWKARIARTVDSRCAELGIPTQLEWN